MASEPHSFSNSTRARWPRAHLCFTMTPRLSQPWGLGTEPPERRVQIRGRCFSAPQVQIKEWNCVSHVCRCVLPRGGQESGSRGVGRRAEVSWGRGILSLCRHPPGEGGWGSCGKAWGPRAGRDVAQEAQGPESSLRGGRVRPGATGSGKRRCLPCPQKGPPQERILLQRLLTSSLPEAIIVTVMDMEPGTCGVRRL